MNVRTLKAESKQPELTTNMRNQGIDILGFVDRNITHEDNINVQQIDQHVIITSSVWRNNANAAVGGTGVVGSKYAEDTLVEIIKYTDRILVAHFNGNPRTTIIVHYAPCESSDESEEHYSNLATATTAIPKHNIVIVMGDFNAHLGADDAIYTFHSSTNSNGKLMIDYLQETNLMISTSALEKKKGKLWTYISDMNGSKSQVDYILINRKWKNSIKNYEAYSSFSSIGSDHRKVSANVKISFRVKKKPGPPQHNWSALQDSANLKQYNTCNCNRYYALSTEDTTDASKDCEHFIKPHIETT